MYAKHSFRLVKTFFEEIAEFASDHEGDEVVIDGVNQRVLIMYSNGLCSAWRDFDYFKAYRDS